MSKNLKLTYILFFVFSAILIAWNTLSNFFKGVAINFIALIGIVFVILLLIYSQKDIFKRIKDLLILSFIFSFLELIIYFACEFGYGEILNGFIVYQNVLSFMGLLLFAYTAFRFATDLYSKKIKFIEIMLGNQKRAIKVKKAKEISNGSLEEKPNHKNEEVKTATEDTQNHADVEIIISEDEE